MKPFLKICLTAIFLAALAVIPAQATADNFSQVASSASIASQVNAIPSSGYSSSAAHLQLSAHANNIFNQASAGKRYSGAGAKNLTEKTKRLVLAAGAQVTTSSRQLALQRQSIVDQRRLDFTGAIERDRAAALSASEQQRSSESLVQAAITAEAAAKDLSQFSVLISQERAKTAAQVRKIKKQLTAHTSQVRKRQLKASLTKLLTKSKQAIAKLQSEIRAVEKLHKQAGEQRQAKVNQAGLERTQIIEAFAVGRQVQAAATISSEITASEKEMSKIRSGIVAQFDGLHVSCQSSLRKLTGNKKIQLPRPALG